MRATYLFAGMILMLTVTNISRSADDNEVAALVKELKAKKPDDRIKAIESLAEMGDKATGAAKSLCDVLVLESNGKVSLAALAAIEKIRPDLHKPLSDYLLDKNPHVREAAIKTMTDMGHKAAPIAGILIARIQNAPKGKSDTNKSMMFKDLAKIKPDDSISIQFYKNVASPGTANSGHRAIALRFLEDWAFADEERKKEVVPLIKAGFNDKVLLGECIRLSGEYGQLSKDLVPTLKKLTLHPEKAIRDAAIKALELIEVP